MASPEFDLPAFQSEVLREVRALKDIAGFEAYIGWARGERLNVVNGRTIGLRWAAYFILLLLSQKLCALLVMILVRGKKLEYYTGAAEELLEQRTVKQLLCSELKPSESDVLKVASVITPVLAAAAQTKTISLSLDPLLFGVCAQVIARTGIDEYCGETISKGGVDPA